MNLKLDFNKLPKYTTGLFLFYFLISSNFLGELYNCSLQKILNTNMLAKHFLGVFTMYTAVVLANDTTGQTQYNLIGLSLCLYLLFLLTTRCNIYFLFIILFLLLVNFVLDKYIEDLEKRIAKFENESNKDGVTDSINPALNFIRINSQDVSLLKLNERVSRIKQIQPYLFYGILIVAITGSLFLLKTKASNNEFNSYDFFVGKATCPI